MTKTPPPFADEPRDVPTLRLGYVPGVTLTKWRRVWDERFPRLGLDVTEVAEADQTSVLQQEQVDMCFVRLPLDEARLHVIPLYEEAPVVVVPRDHPAALFDEVSRADLDDEEVLEGFAIAEAMDLVANGAGIVYVPQSVARSASRRDVVHRPVSDGTPTRVALAWLRENPHEMIQEFVGIVRGRTVNSSRTPRPEPTAPAKTSDRTAVARTAARGRRPRERRPGRGR
ncbi:LysR family substrate-binding domain-containing protein [uncultured Friedmanniella sp.]|uniref:LysR family substrate-binding domain-containing protein n=1 Tax=uncultured Friedmanniella sp. TaxID=335381 RepID=UPI0035CA1089